MDELTGTPQLLKLRKLTRTIAEQLRAEMVGHLTTLAPLLRPATVLGDFVQGGPKILQRGPEAAFKELVALYQEIAPKAPFNLNLDVKAPLDCEAGSLEMLTVQYQHVAVAGNQTKTVRMTSPLRWILGYADWGIEKLRALVADPNRDRVVLQRALLHVLMLHVVVTRQTGVTGVLEALRLPVSSGTLPGLGQLPVTFVSSSVPTVRPSDGVIIESTEVSGSDVFQEIADLDAIVRLDNPFRSRLISVVRAHDEGLLPDASSHPS